MATDTPAAEAPAPAPDQSQVTLAEFLAKAPPGVTVTVTERLSVQQRTSNGISFSYWTIDSHPDVRLHCPSQECLGVRSFELLSTNALSNNSAVENCFLRYRCRNCQAHIVTFSVHFVFAARSGTLRAWKFGQLPEYGDPIPSQLLSTLGASRNFFFKGRKAENAGLGIAAFAYYRRVIEDQRNQLFEAIINVSRKLGADAGLIADMENAKAEKQFTKSVEQIKAALPSVLYIDGHNPLKLLHDALGDGLHTMSDEQCLETARDIRMVLTAVVVRIADALKEESELSTAVSNLLSRRADKAKAASAADSTP